MPGRVPTTAELDRLVAANRAIRDRATKDVKALWVALAGLTAEQARDALIAAMPALIARYGEIAATIAADFYDEQRDIASAPSRYTADLAPVADPKAIAASTRWAVAPLFQAIPDMDATLGRLVEVVDDKTIGQGKRTQVLNAQRDPAQPRVARVPVGKTCAWCRMLASRGPVYQSEATALAASHSHCDCVPTPIWRGSVMPDGYDPSALYADYRRAADAARSSSPKAILAEMRKQTGLA